MSSQKRLSLFGFTPAGKRGRGEAKEGEEMEKRRGDEAMEDSETERNENQPEEVPSPPDTEPDHAPTSPCYAMPAAGRNERRGKRKFNEKWKDLYPWLEFSDDGIMFCSVCRAFPQLADTMSHFYEGSSNFRKSTIEKHKGTRGHSSCVKAQKLQEAELATVPQLFANMNAEQLERVKKLFRTAYFVVKEELPFTTFSGLVALQADNGLDMGSTYRSDQACRRFTNSIYDDLLANELVKSEKARYVSILVDSATDVSNKDLEVVYLRYVRSGLPVNVYIGLDELETPDAGGHRSAVETIVSKFGLLDWWDSIIGFGSDGAAVMTGVNRGLAARLQNDFPWITAVHCLAHRLELSAGDVIKEEKKFKDVLELLESLYKMYKVSPKLWRELREVGDLLGMAAHKLKRVQGTRWLPHIKQAMETVLHNYGALIAHMEDIVEQRRGSADIQGRARKALKSLKNFTIIRFMYFLLDILDDLSRLSLKFQEDALTLSQVTQAIETTNMSLKSKRSQHGPRLQGFLQDVSNDQYMGVDLQDVHAHQDTDEQFTSQKSKVIDLLLDHLKKRFETIQSNEVLSAASIINVKLWRSEEDALSLYGNAEITYLCKRYEHVLNLHGCTIQDVPREWLAAKVYILQLPKASWNTAWNDIFEDPSLCLQFNNLLHVVEIILALPLSTAACERGFSCLKRVKSDWRASLGPEMLTKLLFISMNGPKVGNYDVSGAVHK